MAPRSTAPEKPGDLPISTTARARTLPCKEALAELRQHAAARLAQCVRNEDTVTRLGEDGYAVVLTQIAHAQDGGRVARKILDALGASYAIDGRDTSVIVSIGIATYPHDAENADVLLRNAQAAMAKARQQGVNSPQFYASPDGKSTLAA